MPELAEKILTELDKTPPDKRDGDFYGSYFMAQSMALKYEESNASLDSFRVKIGIEANFAKAELPGLFNIYEVYNEIKMLQRDGDNRSDAEILKEALPVVLSEFKGKALEYAIEPYQLDPVAQHAEWQKILKANQSRTRDSMNRLNAEVFLQQYMQHLVYDALLAPGKEVIRAMDNRNFVIQDSVLIPMRDKKYLSAVIVRPRLTDGALPVVMMATIYATNYEAITAKEIAGHGYVGIILNIRGKYLSDEIIEPWEHDAQDVYDAIDWISRQAWCNGSVGMFGGSYLGFTQWAATKKLHPALKTIVPQVAAAPGYDFPNLNGIVSTYSLRWVNYVTSNKFTDEGFMDIDHWKTTFNNWFTSGQPFNKLDSIEGKANPIFQRWLQHPAFDSYWQRMIPYRQDFKQINIPVLTITGYFDGEQSGALYYFREHYKWNPSANHYLVIGPYTHSSAGGGPLEPDIYGYKPDPVSQIDIPGLVYQWFNYTLKGGKKPDLLSDKVNYQVLGTNRWEHSASFSSMNNSELKFYLSDQNQDGYYKLSDKPNHSSLTQQIDFALRKKSNTYGSTDAKMLSDSLDTKGSLTFISEVLNTDFAINGSFTANLVASINKSDMDFAVGLYVQGPDGKYFPISAVTQRASHAKDVSKRALLTPGKSEMIPISSDFTSVKILKGSRLFIQLSLVKSIYVQVNYGTGKPVSEESLSDAKEPLIVHWSGASEIRIPIKK